MLYARDELGQLIEASKGATAYCPGCGSRVRPKCGSIVTHHWAHISGGDCDIWSEPESAWHKRWKEHFPMHCREVVMGANNEHRADVRLDKRDGDFADLKRLRRGGLGREGLRRGVGY